MLLQIKNVFLNFRDLKKTKKFCQFFSISKKKTIFIVFPPLKTAFNKFHFFLFFSSRYLFFSTKKFANNVFFSSKKHSIRLSGIRFIVFFSKMILPDTPIF